MNTMETDDVRFSQVCSYLALRKAVGWIGILLPFVLMLGLMLFSGGDFILKNISVYYYTVMRDVLVGSICAIALFLFFYRGYSKWDNLAANLAGFFALGIALFPTVKEGPWDWSANVHFVCAAFFFVILSLFSLVLFTKRHHDPTKRKLKRNIIYITCGSVMIGCMVAILISLLLFGVDNSQSDFVFWAETLALNAFGISWLTKGGTLYPDKGKKRPCFP